MFLKKLFSKKESKPLRIIFHNLFSTHSSTYLAFLNTTRRSNPDLLGKLFFNVNTRKKHLSFTKVKNI